MPLKIALGIGMRLRVSAAAQIARDIVGRGSVAYGNRFGSGEDLGGLGERPAELLIDDAGVLLVGIAENGDGGDDQQADARMTMRPSGARKKRANPA